MPHVSCSVSSCMYFICHSVDNFFLLEDVLFAIMYVFICHSLLVSLFSTHYDTHSVFYGYQLLMVDILFPLSTIFQILPEKYCYHRKVEDSSNQPIDCVICMTTIDLTQRTSEYMVIVKYFWHLTLQTVITGHSLYSLLQVAPCEHIFHSGCLQRWMDIKMECPTCRRALPPA